MWSLLFKALGICGLIGLVVFALLIRRDGIQYNLTGTSADMFWYWAQLFLVGSLWIPASLLVLFIGVWLGRRSRRDQGETPGPRSQT